MSSILHYSMPHMHNFPMIILEIHLYYQVWEWRMLSWQNDFMWVKWGDKMSASQGQQATISRHEWMEMDNEWPYSKK